MMNKLYKIEKTICALFLLLFVICGFMQVLFRYALKLPLDWAEEIIVFASIWAAFLGGACATYEQKHIFISVIVDRFPENLKFAVTILSEILWLAVCAVLVYAGTVLVETYYNRGMVAPGSGVPYWISMLAVPVGSLLMFIHVVELLVKEIKSYKADDAQLANTDAGIGGK